MLSENTPVLPQGLSKSKESVPSECRETLHFGRCGIPETWTDLEGHMHRRGMPLPPRAQSDTPPRAVPALFASSWQTPDPGPAISQHRSTSMVYRHKCFRISNPTIKDEKIQTSQSKSIQQLPQQFPQLFFFPSQLSHGSPPAPQPQHLAMQRHGHGPGRHGRAVCVPQLLLDVHAAQAVATAEALQGFQVQLQ